MQSIPLHAGLFIEPSLRHFSLDLIDFETEGGWWKTAGPKYGPAVEDSIEKIVFKLAQRLIASREQMETDIP